MTDDWLINDFAIRSFRNVGDEDYISARMAFRAALVTPSLWASQQALEKYLKCILLLNRIPGAHVGHKLGVALDAIKASGKLLLELTRTTQTFIRYLDELGPFRYLEISNVAFGPDLIRLDRAAWELRRYCTLSDAPKQIKLRQGVPPPKVRIDGGYLEGVIDDIKNPAREPLLWQNAFFGARRRRHVRRNTWIKASNAPLYLNPQILDEILKYVRLPKEIIEGYRAHKKPH
jgi:HEPN domain-containing protein